MLHFVSLLPDSTVGQMEDRRKWQEGQGRGEEGEEERRERNVLTSVHNDICRGVFSMALFVIVQD